MNSTWVKLHGTVTYKLFTSYKFNIYPTTNDKNKDVFFIVVKCGIITKSAMFFILLCIISSREFRLKSNAKLTNFLQSADSTCSL